MPCVTVSDICSIKVNQSVPVWAQNPLAIIHSHLLGKHHVFTWPQSHLPPVAQDPNTKVPKMHHFGTIAMLDIAVQFSHTWTPNTASQKDVSQ